MMGHNIGFKGVLLMGHNIGFKGVIWKIMPKLSLLLLLIRSTDKCNKGKIDYLRH